MRHLIITLVVVSAALAAFTGCEDRTNYRVAPNRDGHAYVDPAKRPPIGNQATVIEGEEIYYTWLAGDTLTGVAKKFNMPLEDLIKRNDIKPGQMPKVGAQIIVKKK